MKLGKFIVMMLRLLVFIYFVFCSNLVLSEPIPVIVISAGKTIQSKSTVGSDITVIGNDQIESSQDFFIGDTIEYSVPGMSMFQSGGYGAVTGIQMRGLPGRYSTVFIDGVKMADPSTPDNRYYGVNQIPADSVERIEVLKGTHSSLYGGSAISGAINIYTKKAEEEGIKQSISLTGGLDSYKAIAKERNLNYNILGKKDDHDFALNLNGFVTEGQSAMTDNTERDSYRSEGIVAKYGYQINDSLRVENNLSYNDTLLEYDEVTHFSGNFGQDTSSAPKADENSTDDYVAAYNFRLIQDSGKFKNQLIFNKFKSVREVIAFDGSNGGNFTGERDTINYLGEYNFNLDTKIVYGLDNEFEKANYKTWAVTEKRENDEYILSQYADVQFRPLDKLYGTFGLRRDEHTVAGEYFTGRGTFAYKKDNNTKYRTSFGNGIRFAALGDYFYGTNVTNIGGITPEKSVGIDFGVDKYIEELGLDLSLTAFLVQYDDHIAGWASNINEKGSTFAVKNSAGEIKNKGIEVATGKLLSRGYNLSLNYAYTDSLDGEDCDNPGRTAKSPIDCQGVLVPKHQISSSLKKTIDNFEGLGDLNLTLNTKYVGERRDYGSVNTGTYHGYASNFHDVILGDYITFDILSNIKINDKVYFMSLKNALSAEYETGYMYGGQERMLNFGVKTEF
jgi:vitamin B12 transporter